MRAYARVLSVHRDVLRACLVVPTPAGNIWVWGTRHVRIPDGDLRRGDWVELDLNTDGANGLIRSGPPAAIVFPADEPFSPSLEMVAGGYVPERYVRVGFPEEGFSVQVSAPLRRGWYALGGLVTKTVTISMWLAAAPPELLPADYIAGCVPVMEFGEAEAGLPVSAGPVEVHKRGRHVLIRPLHNPLILGGEEFWRFVMAAYTLHGVPLWIDP